MTGGGSLKRCRKGARSCTECRRRKLRCAWTAQDPDTCRRCEERGIQCAPQVFVPRSATSSIGTTTTRDRVARLENHVAELVKVVRHLEKQMDDTLSSDDVLQPASQVDDSGYEMLESDNFIPARPSYMNALFNNEHISSADTAAESVDSPNSSVALPSPASDRARALLSRLIPSRQDVAVIATWSSGWLAFINSVLPIASVSRSGEEMVAQYDEVQQPTVDPAVLASWLTMLALTAEHIPKTQAVLELSQSWLKTSSDFSRRVAEAVEAAIVTPDQMATTPSGVDTILLLTRLHIMRGSFMKSFLHLRRALAAAEVIGLPQVASGPRAMTWKCACSIERFHSMILAFPSATRGYPKLKPDQIFIGDRVVPAEFISYLSDVAVDLGDLGGPSINSSDPDVIALIAKMDDKLQRLASLAPPEWWSLPETLPAPDQLMQHLYHYVKMRIYLPTFLRPSSCAKSVHGWSACISACVEVAKRYVQLYPMLPGGSFMHRITTLQVFTATVILLLSDHQASLSEQPIRDQRNNQVTRDLLAQVVKAMDDVANRTGLGIAREAIVTIQALVDLLGTGMCASQKDSIILSVPLLGKIHLQRRADPTRYPELQLPVYHSLSPGQTQRNTNSPYSQSALAGSDAEGWDFSWSIAEAPEPWFFEMGSPGDVNDLGLTM